MAETLGSLCDKLTIVKLKQYHSEDEQRLQSLSQQQVQLQAEIDQYIGDAFSGSIPLERLRFASNKVFKKDGNAVADVSGSLGQVFSQLADVNCNLWHEQEKVYDFIAVHVTEKDEVVRQLAVLNLERNRCIDEIDRQLSEMIQSLSHASA